MWIATLDQGHFLGASPPFQLLLACDGLIDVGEFLEMHQTRDAVSCGESIRVDHHAVIRQTRFEVAGDADVEDSAKACENVDVVELHAPEATSVLCDLLGVARRPPTPVP